MMDIIAIAMLCQIHSGSVDVEKIEKAQKACQEYYAKCFEDYSLQQCIEKRK